MTNSFWWPSIGLLGVFGISGTGDEDDGQFVGLRLGAREAFDTHDSAVDEEFGPVRGFFRFLTRPFDQALYVSQGAPIR